MALDYFTMTPEMKAPVDVAAAVGKYNSQMQVPEAAPAQDDFQVDGAPVHYQLQVISFPCIWILTSIISLRSA